MKKLLFVGIIFLFSKEGFVQPIISLSPGSNIFISAGTTVSFDDLALIPSADISFTGINRLSKTKRALQPPSDAYVRSVFDFAATTVPFSGTVVFRYTDAELNNIPEETLTLNVYDGQQWRMFGTNVKRDPGFNLVTTTGLSDINLKEIILASDFVPLPANVTNRVAAPPYNTSNRLQLYPNPATANLTVLVMPTQNNTATLTMINAAGEKVQQLFRLLTRGDNLLRLNVQNLPAGTYLLSVLQNGELKNMQFVKQ